MAQVPNFDEGAVLRGRNQQNRTTQTSGAQLDGGLGAALQTLGKGVADAADYVDFKLDLEATNEAESAVSTMREAERQRLYNPETGYLQQTGANAVGGARDGAMTDLRDDRTKIADGLSPRARSKFLKETDQRLETALDVSIRHEGVELKKHTLDTFEASTQGHLDDALRASNRDDLFGASMLEAEKKVRQAGALAGLPPEQIELNVQKLTSAGHAGRVIEFARTDPVNAWRYLNENQEKIGLEDFNKLHTQLEPVFYAASARDWVRDRNIGPKSRFEELGFPSFIVTSESSGNVNAKNQTGSTAEGLVQFTEGTYLGLVKQMQREGLASWSVGMSDQQILATRSGEANLPMMAEVYRRFRSDNQKALRNAGIPVTDATEYMAHHFGAGGATALWQAALSNPGGSLKQMLINTVGPKEQERWFAQNPWMPGQTVGSAMQWFQRKAGGGSSVRSPGLAMADAAAIEDPKLREAVIRELNTQIAADTVVRETQDREANDEAWRIANEQGPEAIPPDLATEVGMTTMNQIYDAQERKLTGVDVTDEATYLELIDLTNTAEGQKQFVGIDLNSHTNNLSQGDLRALKALQQELKADLDEVTQNGRSSKVMNTSDRMTATSKFEDQFLTTVTRSGDKSKASKEEKLRWPQMRAQLDELMRQHVEATGSPPSGPEQQRMFESLMVPIVIEGVNSGWGGKSLNIFDIPSVLPKGATVEAEVETIPPEDMERISDDFLKTFDRPPTEEEAVEAYEAQLLQSFGVKSTVTIREVPKDIRKLLRAENPGLSDQGLVDIYRDLMVRMAIPQDDN